MKRDRKRPGRLLKPLAAIGLVAVSMAVSVSGTAGETLDGESLFTELGCVYCHGAAGRDPALDAYPRLAGQQEAYLVQQTKDIRGRARVNGYTGMMQPAVVNVTDEQIAAIAAWLAAQPR